MLFARKSENSIWQESARRLLPPSLKMKIKMMITMRFIDKSENLIWRESAIRLLPPSLPVLSTCRIKKWTSPSTKVSLPSFHFDSFASYNDDSFISRTIKNHMIRFLRPQEVFTMVLDCPLTFTLLKHKHTDLRKAQRSCLHFQDPRAPCFFPRAADAKKSPSREVWQPCRRTPQRSTNKVDPVKILGNGGFYDFCSQQTQNDFIKCFPKCRWRATVGYELRADCLFVCNICSS